MLWQHPTPNDVDEAAATGGFVDHTLWVPVGCKDPVTAQPSVLILSAEQTSLEPEDVHVFANGGVSVLSLQGSKESKRRQPFCFQVISEDLGDLLFSAESQSERDAWIDAIVMAGGKLGRVGQGILADDGVFSFDAPQLASQVGPEQADVLMASYLLKINKKKKKKGDRKWYVLEREGIIKVFKEAESFSRKSPTEEIVVLGSILTREDQASMKLQLPSTRDALVLEADDDGLLQSWLDALVEIGAVLIDSTPPAADEAVDSLSEESPMAVDECCFEDFIFSRGTPREKTISPVLSDILKVARSGESTKKGTPEQTSSWGDLVECNFCLDGQLLVLSTVMPTSDLEMLPENGGPAADSSPTGSPGELMAASPRSVKLIRASQHAKQHAKSAALKANDLKVRAAKKILTDSFEVGDGQLRLDAAKHHNVGILEDECAFTLRSFASCRAIACCSLIPRVNSIAVNFTRVALMSSPSLLDVGSGSDSHM
eukprot:COSAG02_NODE_7728_length_2873_cov_1.210526_2_plen_486_part_00